MSGGETITCRDLLDFIGDYLSGELDEERRGIFEDHLRICEPCDAYLESYRVTIDSLRAALPGPDVMTLEKKACEDCPEELIQAILAANRGAGIEAPEDSADG